MVHTAMRTEPYVFDIQAKPTHNMQLPVALQSTTPAEYPSLDAAESAPHLFRDAAALKLIGFIMDLEVNCRWGMRRRANGKGWEHDPSLCTKTLPRGEAAAHEAVCDFRVVECPHNDSMRRRMKCKHTCRHRDLAHHLAECELRPVTCPNAGCDAVLSFNRADAHAAVCRYQPRKCPNDGCGEIVSAEGLAEHRSVCPREEVLCEFDGCDAWILREDKEAHDTEHLRQHLALTLAALNTVRADTAAALKAEREDIYEIYQNQKQEITTQLISAFQPEIDDLKEQLEAVAQQHDSNFAPVDVLHVPRDHATLQAAVDASKAGDRVVLAAGIYNGKTIINNKQVEILGAPKGGRVVLEYKGNGNVVLVKGATSTATLSNLTIRHRGGVTDTNYGAVGAIGGSTVQVEACEMSSEGGGGVYSRQEGSDLRLHKCMVHNCRDVGVLISSKAKATVEGCTICSNGSNGITVQRGASAILRNNACTDNKGDGLCINELEGQDPTSAVVENNQLTGNTGDNLYVSDLCLDRVKQINNTVADFCRARSLPCPSA